MNSYVFWNNKGGVGKSTLCFNIATEYAKAHLDEIVLVIDACPQANVTTMLLGGGINNRGEENLVSIIETSEQPTKSIVGYFADKVSTQGSNRPPEEYMVRPYLFNENIPSNIMLLPGDGNLELIAPVLSERAFSRAVLPQENPWLFIHTMLSVFINQFQDSQEQKVTVFIDTNPSFSIYTEIAISSANFLLIPLNADDSSRQAFKALLALIYGIGSDHPVWSRYTYARLSQENNLPAPKIHLLLGNRFTSYTREQREETQNTGTATAFYKLNNTIVNLAFEYFSNPEYKSIFSGDPNSSLTETNFETVFTHIVRDFNSAGVVAAFNGIPLGSLRERQATYPINNAGETVTIEKSQRDKCREAVAEIIGKLTPATV